MIAMGPTIELKVSRQLGKRRDLQCPKYENSMKLTTTANSSKPKNSNLARHNANIMVLDLAKYSRQRLAVISNQAKHVMADFGDGRAVQTNKALLQFCGRMYWLSRCILS
jgi:hypothetical protein